MGDLQVDQEARRVVSPRSFCQEALDVSAQPAALLSRRGAEPPLSPANLLSLQRSSGNASVAGLLARSNEVVARKAAVELPGWGDELFGDDDSKVTFTPKGEFRTSAVDAAMADVWGNMDQLMAHARRGEWVTTSMEERGGYRGTLPIKAGTKGTVKISVTAHWFVDQKINDEFDQTFSCSWDVEADRAGKLTIGELPHPDVLPMGPEAPFQGPDLNPLTDEDAGVVQIAPKWLSFQNTDIPNTQISIEADGKVISGGGSVTLGNERTYQAAPLHKAFDLRLQVVDIPPAEPAIEIGPIQMRKHAVHEVLFEKPGQDQVSGTQEEQLYLWYMSLAPQTRALVRSGDEVVKLDGFASTTDRAQNNRILARGRVASVMEILRDFGAKNFDDAAFGEYKKGVGEPEGEVETQAARKVVIEIIEAPVTVHENGATTVPSP